MDSETRTGTRKELMDELFRQRADYNLRGHLALGRRFEEAFIEMGKGADEVTVEGVLYRVVED